MIRNRTIICIASNWEVDPTSKHHVMKLLSRDNTVLWVSYHGMRRPQLNRADARGATSALRRVLRGPQWVGENFAHFTPMVIPGATGSALEHVNRWMVTAQIRRVLRKVRKTTDEPVQIWSFAPDVDFLAGQFDEECVVYYCVDEHAEFEGVDPDATRAAEQRLLDSANVVFATSDALFTSRSAVHPNVHLVRHGVDHSHFSRAVGRDLQKPADLPRSRGPVIGFFGLLHHWIDLELIASVAKRMPHAEFVLIGDPQVDTAALRSHANVHLLGRKPYDDLPAYCAGFDVGILPFKCNELTRHVNPIKLREYLAAGLPVVSTPLPEARPYEPEVTIADGAASFARACEQAAGLNSPQDRLRRSRAVANESWANIIDRISPIAMRSSASPRSTRRHRAAAPLRHVTQ